MFKLHMPPIDVTCGTRVVSLVRNQYNMWTALEMPSYDRERFSQGKEPPNVDEHAWVLRGRWFNTPRQCITALFGNSAIAMSRNSWVTVAYWDSLYLQYLSHKELDQRFTDVMGLFMTLGLDNKLRPAESVDEYDQSPTFPPITTKASDVFEECRRRYGQYYPKSHKYNEETTALSLPMSSDRLKLARNMVESIKGCNRAIVRFGKQEHMLPFYHNGEMRLSAASTMPKLADDLARKDDEMAIVLLGPKDRRTTIQCGDYWMWCATEKPRDVTTAVRLFQDFKADSCVVIRKPVEFLRAMVRLCRMMVPNTEVNAELVRYVDPVTDAVNESELPLAKHFHFLYQNEVRLVCVPKAPGAKQLARGHIPLRINGGLARFDAEYIG